MQNLIKNSIGIILKGINFKNVGTTDSKKIEFKDEFKVVKIEAEFAEFEISRNINVDLQNAYNLKVVAGLQVYAKDGVDLTKALTDKIIQENKGEISGMAMNFMSSLVAQITGSFNGLPIITTPSLKEE